MAARIERARQAAGGHLRFAVRLHVISRDTSGAAWAEVRRLHAALSLHNGHNTLGLQGNGAAKLEVHPNLWSGIGLLPGGPALALVGNHAEVAGRVMEYHAAGVDEFVLDRPGGSGRVASCRCGERRQAAHLVGSVDTSVPNRVG